MNCSFGTALPRRHPVKADGAAVKRQASDILLTGPHVGDVPLAYI